MFQKSSKLIKNVSDFFKILSLLPPQLPAVLCLQVQRTVWTVDGPMKRRDHVPFPDLLDMSPYLSMCNGGGGVGGAGSSGVGRSLISMVDQFKLQVVEAKLRGDSGAGGAENDLGGKNNGLGGEGSDSGVGDGVSGSGGIGDKGDRTSSGVGDKGDSTSSGVGDKGDSTSSGVGDKGDSASGGVGDKGDSASGGVGSSGARGLESSGVASDATADDGGNGSGGGEEDNEGVVTGETSKRADSCGSSNKENEVLCNRMDDPSLAEHYVNSKCNSNNNNTSNIKNDTSNNDKNITKNNISTSNNTDNQLTTNNNNNITSTSTIPRLQQHHRLYGGNVEGRRSGPNRWVVSGVVTLELNRINICIMHFLFVLCCYIGSA